MFDETETNQQVPPKELADHFFFFVERFWIILICVIACVILGLFKHSRTEDSFRSSAVIEALQTPVSASDPLIDRMRGYRPFTMVVAALKSKLYQEGIYIAVAGRDPFAHLLPDPASVSKEEFDIAKRTLAMQLRSSTDILDQTGSALLTVSTVHSDPEVAKEAVDGILEELALSTSNTFSGASVAKIELLNTEIQEIRSRLSQAENSMAIYNRALTICQEISESEKQILEMQKIYLDKWPPLVQERKHLELLQAAFSAELERIIKSVDSEKAFWDSLSPQSASLSDQELIAFQIANTEARHNMIDRDFESDSQLYDSLVSRVKLGDVEQGFEKKEFSIVQPAAVNYRSIRKSAFESVLPYATAGLFLGIMLALLHGLLDSTIRRVEDVERISGLSVYSVVPKSESLATREETGSSAPQAEAFRTLHASLSLAKPDAKKILITSSTPSEGKSTISSNLAATDAISNPSKKIILIDLDLRRPKIAEYLGLPKDHKGVFECLGGKCSVQDAIQKTADGYDVMTGGNITTHNTLPDESLITQLLEVLEKKYDRIIIDSAPILAVSDTLIIAKHVDALCLVFRMWKTPRKALRRALAKLSENETYPVGIVSNFMPQKKLFGQENYYYSYSNTGYSTYQNKA